VVIEEQVGEQVDGQELVVWVVLIILEEIFQVQVIPRQVVGVVGVVGDTSQLVEVVEV